MSDLSQPVLEAMDELNDRVREVQFTRGILGVIAVAIGVLLGLMLIDLIFSPPERWMQFGLSAAGLAIILFFVWRWLFRPGAKRLKPLEIARHLETVHPELEERLSSAIELSQRPDPGVSQSMVHSVINEALEDVEKLDPDEEITTRSVRPFRNAALIFAALMLIIFAVQPSKSFRLAGRALMPWMDIGNVWSGGMLVEPGDLVALRGTPIDLTMQMAVKRRPPPVFLERSGPDGNRTRERMPLLHTSHARDDDRHPGQAGLRHHFALHIPEADESFRYRIACGRRLSAWHDIEVVDRPRAEELRFEVEWPDYTGWGRVADTNELVSALIGSTIHTELIPNKEIAQFGLWYGDPERAERLGASSRRLAQWSFELTADHAGPVTVRMRDRHGFEGEAVRALDPMPDGAPSIDLLLPLESKLRLRTDATLHLGAFVEDNTGVAGMELVVEGAGEPVRQPLPEAFAASAIPGEAASFDIGAVLELRQLELRNTRAIKVWLEAWDNSPDAQRGRSRPVYVVLDKEADSQLAQEIERQAEQARKQLDSAIDAVKAAREAAKEGSPRDAADRARQADAQTRELAAALSESMMNQLGEEARETADAFTEPAVQAAERVPLTDTPEQENQLRNQVAQNMSDAEKALEEMKAQLDELRQELQQLADIKQLAERERGIAEAAAALEGGSQQQADAQQQAGAEQLAGSEQAGSESGETQQARSEQAGSQTEGEQGSQSEPGATQRQVSEQFDPLQAQQADATSQIGEAMQNDDQAMAGQRQAAAQRSAELAQAAGELAAMEEALQGAQGGERTDGQAGTEALRQALQEAIGAQQEALAEAAEAAQASESGQASAGEQAMAGEPSDSGDMSGEPGDAASSGPTPGGQNQEGSGSTEQSGSSAGEPRPNGQEPGQGSEAGDGQPGNQASEAGSENQDGQPGQAGSEPGQSGEKPSGSPNPANSSEGEPGDGAGQENTSGSSNNPAGNPANNPANTPASMPPGGSEPGGSQRASEAAREAAEQMRAGNVEAAQAAAEKAASALEQRPTADPSDTGKNLAERQQDLAEQMQDLAAGDLDGALEKTRGSMAEMAAELAEQAKSLAAAAAAAGQDAQAGQALEAGQQLADAADAQQQAAQAQAEAAGEGSGPSGTPPSPAEQTAAQTAGDAAAQAAEHLREALESLKALAQQTAEQTAPGMPDSPGENPLADALQAAAEASTADTPAGMERGASEAADALDLAAQQAQEKLGLSQGIPGLPQAGRSEGMPVPLPGNPSGQPGSQAGNQQPGQPGGKQAGQQAQNQPGQQEGESSQGESPEGGGAPEQDFSAVPPALKELGVSASDWSRLRGRVDSRTGRSRADGVPAEYRELVERYFESIASER